MKPSRLFVAAVLAAGLLSCRSGEKDRLLQGTLPGTSGATAVGTISFASGGNSFGAIVPTSVYRTQSVYAGELDVQSVDITQDGITWTTLVSTPIVVSIQGAIGPLVQFEVDPVVVPAGEYHGVRLRLGSGSSIRQLSDGSAVAGLQTVPEVGYFVTPGFVGMQGMRSTIELTSRNGYFTPFRVEPTKNIFVVFGVQLASIVGNGWTLYIGARATSIAG